MTRHIKTRTAFSTSLLLVIALLSPFSRGDGKDTDQKKPEKTEGVVSGLMTDFKDGYMLVQLDDQDEPTKFVYGPGITQKGLVSSHIFPVDRVNVKFKTEGDDRKVLAVEKVNGRAAGVIVGKVIKVYNDFWVSVKPSNGGAIEGFALSGPAADKTPGYTVLKSLNPGDLVAIKYATDFERHRIQQIQVKPAPAPK